jgi:hypothetical protein
MRDQVLGGAPAPENVSLQSNNLSVTLYVQNRSEYGLAECYEHGYLGPNVGTVQG